MQQNKHSFLRGFQQDLVSSIACVILSHDQSDGFSSKVEVENKSTLQESDVTPSRQVRI